MRLDERGATREPATYGEAARVVAADARRRGQEVIREAGGEARALTGHLRSEANGALSGGKAQLAVQIAGVAKALRAGGREFRGDDLGGLAAFSDALAEQVEAVQGYLEARSSEALIGDVRDFARRHRGLFLGSLLVAGFVAVRLAQQSRAEPQTTAAATPRPRVGVYRADGL